MVAVVDLLPHVQIVVGTGVEFEGCTAYVMEHEIGAEHVDDVGEGPRCFLRDAGDDVEEDFECDDENDMDRPCA